MSKANLLKPKPTRRRLTVEERQAEILSASMRVFENTPYEQVSVAMLAKAAGMSSGLLYHYYPSKQAVFMAAYAHFSESLVKQCLAQSCEDPKQFIAACLDAYLAYAQAHPGAVKVILSPPPSSAIDLQPFNAQLNEQLMTLLQALWQVPVDDAVRNTGLRAWVAFVDAGVLSMVSGHAVDTAAFKSLAMEVLTTVLSAKQAKSKQQSKKRNP